MRFPIRDYDLTATLESGQAFRWDRNGSGWESVLQGRWVRLEAHGEELKAEVATGVTDWKWLEDYLSLNVDLAAVIHTFPNDDPMQCAVKACRGLRLLMQDPWECLASFILSSTKQIVQIRQCVTLLCERFGLPVVVPPGYSRRFSFPEFNTLAEASESELRACKLGFRARYLSAAAKALRDGSIHLQELQNLTTQEARNRLIQLPGVGPKIANCVLLFAYGRQDAFPIDVWILRALKDLYFPRKRPSLQRLIQFTETYFGPNAGYAQQYLFHYIRTQTKRQSPHKPKSVQERIQQDA